MANLGRKNGVYHVRFRFGGKEYKKSLGIRERTDAEAGRRAVEQTIFRLMTGLLTLPPGVDTGDFIVSGGTLTEAPGRLGATAPADPPAIEKLIQDYLSARQPMLADSYHYLQKIHLNHWSRYLGDAAKRSCAAFTQRDLLAFLQSRAASRSPATAAKERLTLIQLFRWAVGQGYLAASPAEAVPPLKGGHDRPPFRTLSEIAGIVERGGLTDAEALDVWDCLYLAPPEIAVLLKTVRTRARSETGFLLHAIPAYTGLRRGEVLRLRWLDVDSERNSLIARSRKQSRQRSETTRLVELHPELREILVEWRRRSPQGQFVVRDADTDGPLEKHRANRFFWQPMRRTDWCLDGKKNWFKVGFHTYRHSFASNLAAAGVDQRVIDEFMGHTTEAMRKRYRHLFPKTRRSAIESFSLHLTGVT